MLKLSEEVKLERERFALLCDWKSEEAGIRLCALLEQKMEEIMQFFLLEKLDEKPIIYMSSEREVFHRHVEDVARQHEGVQYFDWMIADTYDGDINILSLETCRETEAHRYMSQEEYDKIIVHEFVHICHGQCFRRQIERDKFCGWFWEALATNLAEQEYPSIAVDCTARQLLLEFPNIPNSYIHAYNIGKYMLSNMEHARILEYVYYPEKLAEDMEKILKKVKG